MKRKTFLQSLAASISAIGGLSRGQGRTTPAPVPIGTLPIDESPIGQKVDELWVSGPYTLTDAEIHSWNFTVDADGLSVLTVTIRGKATMKARKG